MPIYEFYCKKCNTLFNFYSSRINTEKIPHCPKCKDVKLERQMSLFSSIASSNKDDSDGPMPSFDESKVEKAFKMLENEAGKVDESDPRQAAKLMRNLSDASGMKLGPGMEEALRRMERGEDPDAIEADMGDIIDGEEPFILDGRKRLKSGEKKVNVDETLYEL